MTDEERRALQNAMFEAMGPGLADTEESRAIEARLVAARAASPARERRDIVGDMMLRAFA